MLADVPKPTQPLLIVLAAIAAAEGIVLVGYAIYDVIQSIRVGLTGPPEVSNLPALVNKIMKGQFAPIRGNYSPLFKQLVREPWIAQDG